MLIKIEGGENMKQVEGRTVFGSKVLGILSICLFFTTWIGMVLGIIGLCLKKDPIKKYSTTDWALNIVGLVLSTIWTIYVFSVMSTMGYY